MNKNELPALAENCLAGFLAQSGAILYSGHDTLRRGDVYLLGFNPGGGDDGTLKLSGSIANMLVSTENKYLDEVWGDVESRKEGEAPLQKRVQWLLEAIGLKTRDVCASNLIFVQSRKAEHVDYAAMAKACWPVHEAIIEIVRPRLILAYGNSEVSPYRYLHNIVGGIEDNISILPDAMHGNWRVRGFATNIAGQQTYVAGLPHLSRYDPRGNAGIVSWLRGKLVTSASNEA